MAAETFLGYTPEVGENSSQIQASLGDIINALKVNREFLINFFLHEKLTVGVPQFHIDIVNYILDLSVKQFALAVPRGFSKTTLVKICVIWFFLFSPYQFVAYCSNTTPVAKDEVRDITNFLSTENFENVFGKVIWEKRNDSEGLFIFKIGQKRCILRALGAGQQVRGINIDNMRPQLLICDDAEDDENSETDHQRAKFRKWVFGALFKACARHSKKIWIANLISNNCVINDLCSDPGWHSVKYGCILKDGSALWPEMFSLQYLKEDFKSYQRVGQVAKWFAEMMNMPVPEGMGLIKAEEIKYRPARVSGDLQYGFITVDPAISQKNWANNTGIAVHGYIDDQWQIVDFEKSKLDPLGLINKVIDFMFKWHVAVVGIESNVWQGALKPFMEYVLVERHLIGIKIIQLFGIHKKQERIATFAGFLKDQTYTLTSGEFAVTQQLLKYDPVKKQNDDDLIDACAYGPQMITEHLGLIMTAQGRKGLIEAQIESASEVCAL